MLHSVYKKKSQRLQAKVSPFLCYADRTGSCSCQHNERLSWLCTFSDRRPVSDSFLFFGPFWAFDWETGRFCSLDIFLSLQLLRFPPPTPWNFTLVYPGSECPALHWSHLALDWSSQPEDSCLSLIVGNVLLLIDWLIDYLFFSPPSAYETPSAALQLLPGFYPGTRQQLLLSYAACSLSTCFLSRSVIFLRASHVFCFHYWCTIIFITEWYGYIITYLPIQQLINISSLDLFWIMQWWPFMHRSLWGAYDLISPG